jgi:segregation and condensation protein B
MMETLSVVAYRQPVSRANAEAVRGVACGEILRQLMERDLIRIVGRSEELGRPYLYGTTKRFLKLFGLTGVEALPPIQWQALREDPPEESSSDTLETDSNLDQSSTSTKEPVVSTAAPVLEATVEMDSQDPTLVQATTSDPIPSSDEASAVLEDEENGAHYTDEDDDDEGWGTDDDEDDIDDDDWDDDDLDDEDDLDEDDIDDDDDLDDELDEKDDDDWEEVDDVDVEDDEWDDEDDDDEEEDDEDWD